MKCCWMDHPALLCLQEWPRAAEQGFCGMQVLAEVAMLEFNIKTHIIQTAVFSVSFEVLAGVFWAAEAGRRKVNYFLGGFNFNLLLRQKEEMQGKDSFSCTL